MNAPALQTSASLPDIERFLRNEARLLDEQRFEDWLELFDERAEYWVPAVWQQESPYDQVSISFDDLDLLRMRVRRLRHLRTVSQQPASRTCHFVSNVLVDAARDGAVTVRSNLLLYEYRANEQRSFAALCEHGLVETPRGYRILCKRVDLLNCDSDFGHLRINILF